MTFSRQSVLSGLLYLLVASTAAAQAPQCSMNASVVANLRITGEAEPVGDLLVTCTGGTPTPIGQTVPGFNITVTSPSAPITSRLLAPNWSEALLIVDEPAEASQLACTTPTGNCLIQGTGTGANTYSGAQGRPNIFQAQQNNQSTLSFLGVPFDPPGAGGVRIFRFTNIRVNPSSLAVQVQVALSISITGAVNIPVNPPQVVVATGSAPLNVIPKGVQTGVNGLAQFTLTFTEGYASAFKTRSTATDPATSPAPVNQSIPNQFLPGVETHFYNSALPFVSGRGNLGQSGLADSGTRFLVVFTGIPQGVSFITNTNVALAPGSGTIRLVSTDVNGGGSYQPAQSSTLFPNETGTITAVFEVLKDDPQTIEHADIPFTISYSSGAPRVDSISASTGLAPLNKTAAADLTAVGRAVQPAAVGNADGDRPQEPQARLGSAARDDARPRTVSDLAQARHAEHRRACDDGLGAHVHRRDDRQLPARVRECDG